MVNYTCSVCGYNTTRKSSYNNHLNRKNPCIKIENNGNLAKNKNDKNTNNKKSSKVDDFRMTVDDFRMTVDE